MMPSVDPREDARRRRARPAAIIAALTIVANTYLSGTRFSGWAWVLWLLSFTVIIAMTSISMYRVGSWPGSRAKDGRATDGRSRSGGPSGHGRDCDTPAAPAPYWARPLRMAALIMPRRAGQRWLAEADSLLSEITPMRRGRAIRSYLLSAPRLAVMMWAHEALQRARLGPRRPG
jgi:hypothetical protein